ncbi:MAG: LacI family DNA-binding transcriptional regulator [Niabella sp.]
MKKRTSLKDVAEKVGVSKSLVSYVLNNQLVDRINKDTAERIKKVALEMSYRPNQIAKSLRSDKTNTIGLIIADIANPYSSTIARIIEDEAKKNNYTVIFGSADESYQKASDIINFLLTRRVDGFIIAAPSGLEKQLIQLKKWDIPFVLIDRYFPELETNCVCIDDFSISFKAAKHLLKQGFKNIAMFNYKTKLFHLRERNRGFLEALKSIGNTGLNKNLVEIDEKRLSEDVKNKLDKLIGIKQKIDAVFFSSSNIALEGLAYLCQKKINVPDDLGVICFDELKTYDLFNCPITYIRQPLSKIGETAIKGLLNAIDSPALSKKYMLPAKLIIRNSSKRF